MKRPRFLQGGLLGGLLSRASGGEVAVKPVRENTPGHVAISLGTLAQTIEPVINTAELSRESGNAVADAWQHVADLVTKYGRQPTHAEHLRLRDTLSGIAEAVRNTPHETLTIQVPLDALRALRYTRHHLQAIAEQLEATPIEKATMSVNVIAFSKTAWARDYPHITIEGRDADILRIAHNSINRRFDTMFALDATTGLDQLTQAF